MSKKDLMTEERLMSKEDSDEVKELTDKIDDLMVGRKIDNCLSALVYVTAAAVRANGYTIEHHHDAVRLAHEGIMKGDN